MGRYKREFVGERRTESITVQLTPTEKTELADAANRQEASVSEYARDLLVHGSAALVAATPRNPEAKALLRELNAIGNNVNQIARELNTTGELPVFPVLREEMALLKRALLRVLGL